MLANSTSSGARLVHFFDLRGKGSELLDRARGVCLDLDEEIEAAHLERLQLHRYDRTSRGTCREERIQNCAEHNRERGFILGLTLSEFAFKLPHRGAELLPHGQMFVGQGFVGSEQFV
jgi:hypothetical protein